MTRLGINIDESQLEAFCKRNGILRLAFFGSVLRDDFGPKSDVDILIDLAPGAGIGFFGLARLEGELTDMLGRRAEIHTYRGLHPLFRDEVIQSADVRYEQA